MLLPNYWLNRPNTALNHEALAAFDTLAHKVLATDTCAFIDYPLPYPKWQFLCYVSEHYPIVLHGSNNFAIDIFEPRQANDVSEFGNQKAVYAASDGLWAMFFAIVDRQNVAMSINNACIRVEDDDGIIHNPHYIFAISHHALIQQPWCNGAVYFLAKQPFNPQAPLQLDEGRVHVAQFVSAEPVKPLAKLEITPEDFPFLASIRGMDDSRFQEYADAMHQRLPWPKDFEAS